MCAQCILTFDLLTGFILFEIIQWEYMKWLIQSFQYRQNGNFSRLWLRRKWFNYTNDPNVITKSNFHLESHSLFVICNLLLYIHFERWIEYGEEWENTKIRRRRSNVSFSPKGQPNTTKYWRRKLANDCQAARIKDNNNKNKSSR